MAWHGLILLAMVKARVLQLPYDLTGGLLRAMSTNEIYRTKQVADQAGISKETLLRWLKEGKIIEPDRDRNGWRAFSEKDVQAIVDYATRVIPSPASLQGKLTFNKKNP